jgi:signal peptidase I
MSRASSRASSGVAETVKTVVYAVIIALFIRTFFYEPFSIPSGSMVPTLLVGDYLFVSKFSYGYSRYSLPFSLPLIPDRVFFTEPKRGDVVVFKLPRDPSIDFIKRIIGLPGDTIQVKDSLLYINNQPVTRETVGSFNDSGLGTAHATLYMETLPNGVRHQIVQEDADGIDCSTVRFQDTQYCTMNNTTPFTVPPGHYFMMGDNRDNSADSRDPTSGVGYVPVENLVGRAEFIFYSTDGTARLWEVWNWPFTVRYDRLLTGIH